MVPIIRLFYNFNVKDAIALSNATIAVAASIRYLINFNKPHPLKFDAEKRPAGAEKRPTDKSKSITNAEEEENNDPELMCSQLIAEV